MTNISSVKCSCQNRHFVKDPGFKEQSIYQRFPPVPIPSRVYSWQKTISGEGFEITFVQPTVFLNGFCGEWRRI
jgi:hypothetical protein